MAYSQSKPTVHAAQMEPTQLERTWQRTGKRDMVAFPHPSPGFWGFVAGFGLALFLGPDIISLTSTGKARLRELAEKKIRGA